MDGFEDKLNSILSDNDAMSRIAAAAKSLLAGQNGSGPSDDTSGPEQDMAATPELISRVARLLRGNSMRSDETALLGALRPFLSEECQHRLDRAIKLARLASLAKLAGDFAGLGGEDDV